MRLIDADALGEQIRRVCDGCNDHGGVYCRACAAGDFMDALEDAPTVELPSWIPVEERLPEEGVQAIVWVYFGSHALALHDMFVNGIWAFHWKGRITHWMPLPEPPEVFQDEQA